MAILVVDLEIFVVVALKNEGLALSSRRGWGGFGGQEMGTDIVDDANVNIRGLLG